MKKLLVLLVCSTFALSSYADKCIPQEAPLNANGEKEGRDIECYDNGQKFTESNFANGILEGKQYEWHSNGQKRLEENYINGKEDGKTLLWDINEQSKVEVNYINGKSTGKFIFFDKEGKEIGACLGSKGKKLPLLTCDDSIRIDVKESFFLFRIINRHIESLTSSP